MFPNTPKTLLKKISELANGDDAAVWEGFVEMYTPVLRNFIRGMYATISQEDLEDAVQDVFVRIVEVLRAGGIDREKGRFRSYLSSVARNILIDRYRERLVRPQPLPDDANLDEMANNQTVGVDPGVAFDIKQLQAIHEAAVEHVLANTAVSAQHKRIYRAMLWGLSPAEGGLSPAGEGLPPKEAAKVFGISHASAKQIKSRLDRAVAAIERRMLQP